MTDTLPGMTAPERDTSVADAARCAAADARLAQKRDKKARRRILEYLAIGPLSTRKIKSYVYNSRSVSVRYVKETLRVMESEGLLSYTRTAGWSVR